MSFSVKHLGIPEVILIQPRRFADARGWFMETYRKDAFLEFGVLPAFVQDNHAFSQAAGTLRGLHFQSPPKAQAKLVRVLRGSVQDVAVDIRRGSPTYGCWTDARLTAEEGEQLYVPAGFAHGYCTLEPDTEVAYKCDAYYSPEFEGGIAASDPEIGISWIWPAAAMVISPKDQALSALRDLISPFEYETNAEG